MGRLVKIVSTRDKQVTRIEDFEGSTFRELKNHYNFDGSSTVVRETKVNLSHDDAILPEGEFTVFVTPEKVKSGNNITSISDNDLNNFFEEFDSFISYAEDEGIYPDEIVTETVETLKKDLFFGLSSFTATTSGNVYVSASDIAEIERIISEGRNGHMSSVNRTVLEQIKNRLSIGTVVESPYWQQKREDEELLREASNL